MKLKDATRIKLCNSQGYIDGLIEIEMMKSGKTIEDYENDPIFNALRCASAAIEEALEHDNRLVNMDL